MNGNGRRLTWREWWWFINGLAGYVVLAVIVYGIVSQQIRWVGP